MKRFKTIFLLALAGMGLSAHAEISGSGHQALGCDGKILSLVWNDANGNGVQDAGEPALSGVTLGLSLRNDPGQGEDLLQTQSDGSVQFFNLCLRSYLLRIDETSLPMGMTATVITAGAGQNHALDSDGLEDLEPLRIDLHENHVIEETVDFGFARDDCEATIGDLVWLDDGNGVQDDYETGLAGVSVGLSDTDGNVVGTAISDANGRYLLANVCSGTWLVSVNADQTSIDGLVPTAPAQGADSDADSDLPADGSAIVYVANTGQDLSLDFGLTNPACSGTLSGDVFLDDDGDGGRTAGETGIEGIGISAVNQHDAAQDAHVGVTDDTGAWRIDGLCAGTYAVAADSSTLPPGAGPTSDMAALDAVFLPTDSAQVIVGTAGYSTSCAGEIGDRVWQDADGDGLQDAGEPGLADVLLTLRNALGSIVGYATSSSSGAYRFRGLCAGDYAVQVDSTTLPDGASPTVTNAGDPGLDSQGPAPTWVTLANAATSADDFDFGFVTSGCVIGLDAGCIVMKTAPRWDHCHDIEELTMLWDGMQPVRIVTHKGDTSKEIVADIDGIVPGAAVSVSVDGAPNDVIWEIYRAGSDERIGESSFHISCSDPAMNGPEDCGARQGDGKDGDRCDGECINDWLLEGVIDKHGVDVSLSCTLGESPATANCSPESGDLVSHRYRLANPGLSSIGGIEVRDGISGLLNATTDTTLPAGGSRTYVSNAAHDASLTNQVLVDASDDAGACSAVASVDIVIAPPPPCTVIGASEVDLSHDKFKWNLSNTGGDPVTISRVTLAWPAQNEDLKEVKLSGDTIFDNLRPATGAELDTNDFEPDEGRRRIDGGKDEDLEVKFATHHHGDQQASDYSITVEFAEGCTATFGVD